MSHLQSITTLPLLDLSQLDGSPQQRQRFLDELRLAARHVGFLLDRGIDPALLAEVQQQARAFLPCPRLTSWRWA
jgi:isopenicillin N synthase-like dioxygenase